jgi:hypothetical protein
MYSCEPKISTDEFITQKNSAGIMVPAICLPNDFFDKYIIIDDDDNSEHIKNNHSLCGPNKNSVSETYRKKPDRSVRSPNGQLCFSCNVKYSPQWRHKKINNTSTYLCNACGLRYVKGQYCPVCHITYTQAEINTNQWNNCLICHKWTHNYCMTIMRTCKKCI